MEPGTRVRMSERLKAKLRGKCGVAGKHVGPFDPEDGKECWGCSTPHVEEFGTCVGIVEGLADFGTQKGPEVDVRWQPSNLRYAYLPEDLDPTGEP